MKNTKTFVVVLAIALALASLINDMKANASAKIRFIGDSVARMYACLEGKGNDYDDAQVSRQPEKILKHIIAFPTNQNEEVYISTGILNSLGTRLDVIEKIIYTLKEQGAKITIIGTPDRGKYNYNEFLRQLSIKYQVRFWDGYVPAKDMKHPEITNCFKK